MATNLEAAPLSPVVLLSLLGMSGLLAVCGCGGHGGHHGGGGGGSLCADTAATSYHGDQVNGGDKYIWCIDRLNDTFEFQDISGGIVPPTQGNLLGDLTFPNLLSLTSTSPSAGAGTAVELPNAALLAAAGNMPTGSTSPSQDVMVAVLLQSGFCPSSADFTYVTIPGNSWTTAQEAYGTISLTSSSATITGFALNGTSVGSQTSVASCDTSKSELMFTGLDGAEHKAALSPPGLILYRSISNLAGVPQASGTVSLTAGGTYLGVLFEPNSVPSSTFVGFRASTVSSFKGFAPLSAGQPDNGINFNLGAQTSPGLFTGGTLVEGPTTDSDFVATANDVAGKAVIFGVTFNSTKNTPVAVLVFQQ